MACLLLLRRLVLSANVAAGLLRAPGRRKTGGCRISQSSKPRSLLSQIATTTVVVKHIDIEAMSKEDATFTGSFEIKARISVGRISADGYALLVVEHGCPTCKSGGPALACARAAEYPARKQPLTRHH